MLKVSSKFHVLSDAIVCKLSHNSSCHVTALGVNILIRLAPSTTTPCVSVSLERSQVSSNSFSNV